MKSETVYVGVDVSKHTLDVDWYEGKVLQIGNTKAGINGLARRIAAAPVHIVVCCESTGAYEKLLLGTLAEAGCSVAYVNATRVRHYAKSRGILAKTDRIDAKVISAFARSVPPRLMAEPREWQQEAKALLTRREELVDMRRREQSRLDPVPPTQVGKLIRQHIRVLSRYIETIEDELRELRSRHPELSEKFSRLVAVKSFGDTIAMSLLAYMPELGSVSGNQAAALAGLAPYNNDSGLHEGRRSIRGGRGRIRNVLYMGAIVAIRHNPVLKSYYEHLKERGKPSKVALTAVMRKMVVLANRLMADPDFQLS